MDANNRPDFFHLVVTLAVFCGGAYLATVDHSFKDAILPIWGAVAAWWFNGKKPNATSSNGS